MESNLQPENELALAERAAVAPWIDTPLTAWWYVPSASLLAGGLVFVLGERHALPSAGYIFSLLALVLLIGGWLGAAASRQGAVPRLRHAPPEFVPVVRGYFIGYGILLALIATVFLAVDSRAAAVVAALGLGGGLFLYERRYAAAAEAVRRRVS